MSKTERILIPKGAEVVIYRQRIVSAKWKTSNSAMGREVVIPRIGKYK